MPILIFFLGRKYVLERDHADNLVNARLETEIKTGSRDHVEMIQFK